MMDVIVSHGADSGRLTSDSRRLGVLAPPHLVARELPLELSATFRPEHTKDHTNVASYPKQPIAKPAFPKI